ncbi:MAG: flagellar basal body rod protein FlgB [bacterium]
MKFSPLNKTLVPILKKSLDAYATRHKAIAENIANIDSQGYRPLKVSFEENLRNMLQKKHAIAMKTNSRHMDIGSSVLEVKETVVNDQDKVDVEAEMAELAKNQIRFEFAARLLARKYENIRASIIGRFR